MSPLNVRHSWLRNLLINKKLPNVLIITPVRAEDPLVLEVASALFCNHYQQLQKYAQAILTPNADYEAGIAPEWPAFCQKCNSCRLLFNQQHPDFVELSFVKLTKQADIWSHLQAQIYLSPFQSSHRIFHFSQAQFMEPVFANQLLKALEDSPAFNLFIFSCDQSRHLLPTIRSRGVEVRLPPQPQARQQEMLQQEKYLAERINHFENLESWWAQLMSLFTPSSANPALLNEKKMVLESLRRQWNGWTQSISERALAQDLLLHLYLKLDHQLEQKWETPVLKQYLLLGHQLEKGLQAFYANQNVKMQLDHVFRGLEQQLTMEQ